MSDEALPELPPYLVRFGPPPEEWQIAYYNKVDSGRQAWWVDGCGDRPLGDDFLPMVVAKGGVSDVPDPWASAPAYDAERPLRDWIVDDAARVLRVDRSCVVAKGWTGSGARFAPVLEMVDYADVYAVLACGDALEIGDVAPSSLADMLGRVEDGQGLIKVAPREPGKAGWAIAARHVAYLSYRERRRPLSVPAHPDGPVS